MDKPQGPYTLWQYIGYENWTFRDFPTLKEALEADRYMIGTDWHISKPVRYDIAEIEEAA